MHFFLDKSNIFVILIKMECGKTPKYLNTDEACVIRAHQGENDALRVLYERYYDTILHYVTWKVTEIEDAKDITSLVFSKVFDKINNLKDVNQFKNWLYTIVNNQIRDFMRSKPKKHINIEDDSPDDIPNPNEPKQNNLYNPISLNVNWVMKKLSESERQVLHLRFERDLTYAEIAKITGKTENNIRIILHRAKKSFEKLYLGKFTLPINLRGENYEKP